MEIKQVNMLDVLRGLISVPAECYSARKTVSLSLGDQPAPISSMFVPPPLREMVKDITLTSSPMNINTSRRSYIPKPGFIDRYFWQMLFFLFLIVGLTIYFAVRMERKKQAGIEWEKLKVKQEAKEAAEKSSLSVL